MLAPTTYLPPPNVPPQPPCAPPPAAAAAAPTRRAPQLEEGTAEVFGTELQLGRAENITGQKLAVGRRAVANGPACWHCRACRHEGAMRGTCRHQLRACIRRTLCTTPAVFALCTLPAFPIGGAACVYVQVQVYTWQGCTVSILGEPAVW